MTGRNDTVPNTIGGVAADEATTDGGQTPGAIRDAVPGFAAVPIDRAAIARMVPQQGTMCLLDRVVAYDIDSIVCEARSHLDPTNPLRWDGRLGLLCGCEYGMQAAALHGALVSADPPPPGRVASLRVTHAGAGRLDDPALGILTVTAVRRAADAKGLLYDFRLLAADGREILSGGGTVALLPPETAP